MVRGQFILLGLLFWAFYCNAQLSQNSIEEFNNLFKAGYYKDAIVVGHIVEEERGDKNKLKYALFLDHLAKCECELENYSLAQTHLNNALKIKKLCCGQKSIEYARTLHYLADCYSYMESPKAFSFEKKAFRIIKKKETETSPLYIEFLLYYAEYLDTQEQQTIVEKCLPLIDTTSLLYAQALNALADCYFYKEQFEHAIEYYLKTIEIRKPIEGNRHPNIAKNYNDLANCYNKLRVPSKDFEYSNMAKMIYCDTHGILSAYYLSALISMAVPQAQMGNLGNAKKMCQEAIALAEELYGQNSLYYAYAINALSIIEKQARDYDNAIIHGEKAVMIMKEELGEEDEDYLHALLNLSEYYVGINDSIAKSLAEEYVSIVKKTFGDRSTLYAYGLVIYSHIISMCEGMKMPLKTLQKAYDIFQQTDKEYSAKDIADYWEILSNYYWNIEKNIDSALFTRQQALDIYYSNLGLNKDDYISSLGELGEILCYMGSFDKGYAVFEDYLKLRKEYILSGFVGLEENDRFLLWNSYDVNKLVLSACGLSPTNPKSTEIAYNMLLFNKGLLLNAELCFRGMYKSVNSPGNNETDETIDHGNRIIEELRNSFSLSWQDIKSGLEETQMAIEFFATSAPDSIYYYAMVLKPEYQHPKMVKLFKSNELKEAGGYSLYNSSALYDLVWKPLADELEGVKTIFFSPDEDLNSVAIESALNPSGQRVSDCFEIYRLSSTREIIKSDEDLPFESIVLYGGLDYYANFDDIRATNMSNGFYKDSLYFAERSIIDDERGTVGVLEGSKREVESIVHMLPDEYPYLCYMGQLGTEESFKALSGHNYDIIHISTHGYYWSESMANRKSLNNMQIANNDLMTEEDKALTRSGLYFAGVNTTLSGEEMPDYLDDGILTAQEISELDFRGTNLVVLSACQTGLGDLKGDGVFGLQRGFKKAGVKSILMSLWKVDDKATELLMVEFYRNYFSGVSKTQSLKNAQRYVMNYSDPEGNKLYENPYYWAGFIMLD